MMRALGLRKSLYLLLTAFFIFLLCFFLRYHNSGLVEWGDKREIMLKPPSIHTSQKHQLLQVLRRAAMSDRSVILTMVDESRAKPGSVLDVFLQSFKSGQGTQRLLNHLVIIAMDLQSFKYCKSMHSHCIHPSTFAHYFATKRHSITSPYHNVFSWRRNNVLLEVLQLGYSIIFTDVDVLWLRSPLSNIDPGKELTISCNISSDGHGGLYVEDGGIFFLKANALAVEFFKSLKLNKLMYPISIAEESLCTTIIQSREIVRAYGLRVIDVDTTYFGGFCHLSEDMLRKAYTIHANCCGDLSSKVHDLRNVLDDWIHLRERSSRNKMALRWPQKCKR
ncbi:hypothetical protein RIF29_26815 [Crotalaria pallida]|uniref:Nucleotide-diphospho-sugar transferase domain-containing protein n=1 Tax=Crotalaria pallida TaxID=3830 RepID=A0AAN9EP26_CROPI